MLIHRARNPDFWLPRRQPQRSVVLDRTHPLSRGLVADYSIRWGMRNLTGLGCDLQPRSARPVTVVNSMGVGTQTFSGACWAQVCGVQQKPAKRVTLRYRGIASDLNNLNDNPAFFGISYDVYNNAPYGAFEICRTGDQVMLLGNADGNVFAPTYNGLLPDQAALDLVATFDVTSGNLRLYVNGALVNSQTAVAGSAIQYDATALMIVGGHSTDTDAYPGGPMHRCQMWNRVLTVAEVRRLFIEPWAALMPAG